MVPGWELYAHTAEAHPLLMDCLNSIVLWSLGDAAAQRLEGLPRFRLRRLLSTAAYAFFFIAPFAHYWQVLAWLGRALPPCYEALCLHDTAVITP